MLDILHDILVAGNKTSDGSERLAVSAHNKIHIFFHAEVFYSPASGLPENSDSVSVIHHDTGAVFTCYPHYFRQVCNISLHAEHSVNNKHLTPSVIVGKYSIEIRHIVVFETPDLPIR